MIPDEAIVYIESGDRDPNDPAVVLVDEIRKLRADYAAEKIRADTLAQELTDRRAADYLVAEKFVNLESAAWKLQDERDKLKLNLKNAQRLRAENVNSKEWLDTIDAANAFEKELAETREFHRETKAQLVATESRFTELKKYTDALANAIEPTIASLKSIEKNKLLLTNIIGAVIEPLSTALASYNSFINEKPKTK